MRCVWIRDHIERYADEDLPGAMRVKIDAHFAACGKCRTVYEDSKMVRAIFTENAAPAIPEGIFDELLETISIRNGHSERRFEKKLFIPGWWMTAAPGIRIAYTLVFVLLTTAGIFMGRDLWKNKAETDVAMDYGDYPGIEAFSTMLPGSVEQTYFNLTSYGPERGGR